MLTSLSKTQQQQIISKILRSIEGDIKQIITLGGLIVKAQGWRRSDRSQLSIVLWNKLSFYHVVWNCVGPLSKLLSESNKSQVLVVAQLVECSPPTPEIRGLNPVIGKLLSNNCLLSTLLKRRNKGKRGREQPFSLKNNEMFQVTLTLQLSAAQCRKALNAGNLETLDFILN